ncbi:hypothetical protein [uncultured Thiodictyon sp.]|uniref:hypothetical protein n=1 Tax=uncultured Thiodictyon sp. TaxID=1846217 RepID=UPI0025FB229C|nr:hypothetical protein [uncultured Thiodictyon sp.]
MLLTGSQLALDILEDGAVARQPAQLRLFARLALRLTELPPGDAHSRLARQYRPEVDAVFQEELGRALADSDPVRRLGAWRTLLPLVDGQVLWTKDLAEANWPASPEEAIEIVEASMTGRLGRWALDRWSEIVFELPPVRVLRFVTSYQIVRRLKLIDEDPFETVDKLIAVKQFAVLEGSAEHIDIALQPVQEPLHWRLVGSFPRNAVTLSEIPPSARSDWKWIGLIGAFLNRPSLGALAELLRSLPDGSYSKGIGDEVSCYTPWPVGACVTAIRQGYNKERLIDLVSTGALGTPEEWRRAEIRWASQGLTFSDLEYTPKNDLPFDHAIERIGFPSDVAGWVRNYSSDDQFGALAELSRSINRETARRALAMYLFDQLEWADPTRSARRWLKNEELREIVAHGRDREVGLDCIYQLSIALGETDESAEILDMLGDVKEIDAGERDVTAEVGASLEQAAIAHPHRGGLLRLLAKACTDGYTPEDPRLLPNPADFGDARMQAAAWLVILAQGRLAPERAGTLVKVLIDCSTEEPSAVDDALGIISNNDLPDASAEAVLLALIETLPPERWQTRGAVIAAMQEHLRRYPSANPDLA